MSTTEHTVTCPNEDCEADIEISLEWEEDGAYWDNNSNPQACPKCGAAFSDAWMKATVTELERDQRAFAREMEAERLMEQRSARHEDMAEDFYRRL